MRSYFIHISLMSLLSLNFLPEKAHAENNIKIFPAINHLMELDEYATIDSGTPDGAYIYYKPSYYEKKTNRLLVRAINEEIGRHADYNYHLIIIEDRKYQDIMNIISNIDYEVKFAKFVKDTAVVDPVGIFNFFWIQVVKPELIQKGIIPEDSFLLEVLDKTIWSVIDIVFAKKEVPTSLHEYAFSKTSLKVGSKIIFECIAVGFAIYDGVMDMTRIFNVIEALTNTTVSREELPWLTAEYCFLSNYIWKYKSNLQLMIYGDAEQNIEGIIPKDDYKNIHDFNQAYGLYIAKYFKELHFDKSFSDRLLSTTTSLDDAIKLQESAKKVLGLIQEYSINNSFTSEIKPTITTTLENRSYKALVGEDGKMPVFPWDYAIPRCESYTLSYLNNRNNCDKYDVKRSINFSTTCGLKKQVVFKQKDGGGTGLANVCLISDISITVDDEKKELRSFYIPDFLYDIENSFAKKYIVDLFKNEIISGYSDGEFKPDGNITNGQFLKMAARAFFYKTHYDKIAQSDKINNIEFSNYVSFFSDLGVNINFLESSESTQEILKKPAKRGYIAKVITNILFYIDKVVDKKDRDGYNKVELDSCDKKYEDSWDNCSIPLRKACIVHGVEQEVDKVKKYSFNPDRNISRDQFAKIISRAMEHAQGVDLCK